MVSTVPASMGRPRPTHVVFGAATHHYRRDARGITLPVSAGTRSGQGLRTLGVALTLVLALLCALLLETGHPAEAADLQGPSAYAVALQHGHDGETDSKVPWHAVHCGAHCAGHAVAQPAPIPTVVVQPATEIWIVRPAPDLTSQTRAVQHRPPRA